MAIQENPYLPPQSRVADAVIAAGGYIDGGRAVPAAHAWDWITTGWQIFRRQSGSWVLLTIVLGLITVVLGVIPIVSLSVSLLMPIFIGGLMLGCRKIEKGDDIELADLFSGFKHSGGALVLVGLIGLGLTIAAVIPASIMVALSGFFGAASGGIASMGVGFIVGMLLFTALLVPVYMALWFAPALVALQGQSATQAVAQSFRGCVRNILPFLAYSVILMVLAIVATIPLMLGWLVLAPVLIASVYAAYRDIYFDQ